MQQPDFKTAKEISQYLLEVTSDALFNHNIDRFAAVFDLPQTMTTTDRRIVISSHQELHLVFDQMCSCLTEIGATQLHRTCEAAEFRNPDEIASTHTTRVLAGDKEIVPVYPVFSRIKRIKGRWKISDSDYDLHQDQPHARVFSLQSQSDAVAWSIYQSHLDKVNKCFRARDFKTFKTCYRLPHRSTTQSDVMVVETPEQVATAFTRFAKKFADIGATDFVQIAKEAQFNSENVITGVHESHLIRNGTWLIKPYRNRLRLRRDAQGNWCETDRTSAISNTADRLHLWAEVSNDTRLPDFDNPS